MPAKLQYSKYIECMYFIFNESKHDGRTLERLSQNIQRRIQAMCVGVRCDLAAIVMMIEFCCIKFTQGTATQRDYDTILAYIREHRSELRYYDMLTAWHLSQGARLQSRLGASRDVIDRMLSEACELHVRRPTRCRRGSVEESVTRWRATR